MNEAEGTKMVRERLDEASREYVKARRRLAKVNLATPEGRDLLRAFQIAQTQALAIVREIGDELEPEQPAPKKESAA